MKKILLITCLSMIAACANEQAATTNDNKPAKKVSKFVFDCTKRGGQIQYHNNMIECVHE